MIEVSPSVLASDFSKLGEEIGMLNESEADYIHLDIMDGLFVPNISFGFPVIESIRELSGKPFDIHLMILDPGRYIEHFARFKPQFITVHLEACTHLHRVIQQIHDAGCQAGVAINPHTSVAQLENILSYADLILIMSVNPGFGGQEFIEETYRKVRDLKDMIGNQNRSV